MVNVPRKFLQRNQEDNVCGFIYWLVKGLLIHPGYMVARVWSRVEVWCWKVEGQTRRSEGKAAGKVVDPVITHSDDRNQNTAVLLILIRRYWMSD